jgi:hypothetical protein
MYNIIYLSNYPWSNTFSRYTNLALALSKSPFVNQLIYLNPLIHIGDCINSKHKLSKLKYIGRYNQVKNTPLDARSAISPIPFTRFTIFRKAYELWARYTIKKIQEELPSSNKILIIQKPSDYALLMLRECKRKGFYIVFDWGDLFEKHDDTPQSQNKIGWLCREIASNSDLVLGVSPKITEIAISVNKRSYVFPNAVWSDLIVKKIKPPRPRNQILTKPKIAYFGLMNRFKLDNNLIKGVVESKPGWEFIFIGPHQDNDLKDKLANSKNITFISQMDGYSIHKYLIDNVDICFFPYNSIDEASNYGSSMKLYETLGLGLPIVATNSFDPLDAKDLIHVGSSVLELVHSIEKVLSEDTVEMRKGRVEYAKKNTWEIRVSQLINIIESFYDHTI